MRKAIEVVLVFGFLAGIFSTLVLGLLVHARYRGWFPEPPPARSQAYVERRLDLRLDAPNFVYRAPWRGPPQARLDCRCEEVRP